MKFANLNSAFLIGVVALSLGGCATTGDSASGSSQSGQTKESTVKKVEPVASAEVSAEAKAEFATAMKLLKAKKYKQAEKLLKAMTVKHPTLSGPFFNLGLVYIQQDKNKEALKVLEQAIKVNPDNIAAYNQLGLTYKELAQFDKSEQSYLQGLAQDGKDPELNYNLGILYDLILQNPKKALYYYEQYLENTSGGDKRVESWIKGLKRQVN